MLPSDLRMPAEWEPQASIWCTWPDNRSTWPDNLYAAQIEFTAMVHSLAEFTPVHVMVNQASLGFAKRNLIRPDTHNVHLMDIATNDAWARDYVPTMVLGDSQQKHFAIDWNYNAWGAKYPPFEADQQVGVKLAEGHQFQLVDSGLCLEGGAIETNGNELLLSTRSCASDPNRNRNVPEAERLNQFELAFKKFLGATETIWLSGDALLGDDTDGHIDQLARFTSPNVIVYAWTDDENDPQFSKLQANLNDLKSSLDRLNLNVELHPLKLPQPFSFFGRQIPASYCNFVISNELVLVPQYGLPEDRPALELLTALFPEHHVFGLPSRNLSVGLGSFHCLTQTVPEARPASRSG